MDKFGRRYELRVQLKEDGDFLLVQLPFTIEFDIIKNTLTSANVCQVRIYNLNQDNRNAIRFNISNVTEYRGIQLRAGYGQQIPIIFSGNISQAWSVREGNNFITQIECYDGGFAFSNGRLDDSSSFPAGTDQRDAIIKLATSQTGSKVGMPRTKVGAIGDFSGPLLRGNSYTGNTASVLDGLTGHALFVDNEKVNALRTNEYIEDGGPTLIINAQSGLLGTPLLEQTLVRFDMILEPELSVGRRVFLESLTDKAFNGYYKVTGVKHRGMISDAVAGDAITSGEFFYTRVLDPVRPENA